VAMAAVKAPVQIRSSRVMATATLL
jgi:hypothetical protein